nr:hypothetical protein [Tanacetum cinerariifolium]
MSALSVIKVQFEKFFHSKLLNPLNYDGRAPREIIQEYTRVRAQSFKEMIIQSVESIEKKCIDERDLYEQEIQKRLNKRKLRTQECKVEKFKALDASWDDSNVILDSSDMNPCKGKVGQHSGKDEDERVLLASLIENLKVDIDENTNIHNDLKKANMSLTLELNQSKLDLRDSKIELS